MLRDFFKSLLFVFICGFCAFSAPAAVSLFSDYGQIQNVQHYSSNPFWSPTAPYNQRLPQPVYATGADLNADDCIRVVQSLVSVQCMARDNCKNTDVSDIRPTIMVQLSNLPGANYVSACSGYIDGIFETYQKQYGNSLPNRAVAFPGATTPNTNIDDSGGIQFENPYKQQPTKWQIEQKERSDELQRLQSQNGVGSEHLTKTDFPATYADLSFSERMENDRAGLEPYKDLKAYKTLKVKSESEWCEDEHANAPECAKYRAKKEAAAQAAAQATAPQQQQDTNNTANNQGNDDNPGTVSSTPLIAAGQECAPEHPEHVKVTQWNALNSKCEIIECEEGWTTNNEWTKCIEKEYGIIMAMYEEGSGGAKPNKCFDRCGEDNTNDGLTRTLREAGLLPEDKSVCTIKGVPYVYYEDNVNQKFVVPKSKKNDLIIAINRIKNSNHYDCLSYIWSSLYYIVLKDEKTEQDIDSGTKLYIVDKLTPW